MGILPTWAELEPAAGQVTVTRRRYLTQISCVLRPGSVGGADLALDLSPPSWPRPRPG
jgi:hypothetical protein